MIQRYVGRSWNERFLPRLSTLEVEQLPKDDALVILPIGAVEQHGPHLPIYTDTFIAELLLTEAYSHLAEESQIWMLPPLPYGKSNEHSGRYGTISLSSSTLQSVVMDIGKGVAQSGFRRLLLFNTHGGNHDLLNMMAREIRLETGLMVFRLNGSSFAMGKDMMSEEEWRLGIHGGDYETSLLMAAIPEWVHAELCPTVFPSIPEGLHWGNFAWDIDDISAEGIAGDAAQASAEKGFRILQEDSRLLADTLRRMASFEIKEIRNKKIEA